jgi:hypothetical protein
MFSDKVYFCFVREKIQMDSINTRTIHCLRVIGAEVQELRRVVEVGASRETNRSAAEVQPPPEDTVDNADRSED